MSLINKALKKEQQRRIGSSPDAALYTLSSHSPARSRRRHDNRSATILIGFVCLGLFILGLSGAIVYFGSQYIAQLDDDSESSSEKNTALASAQTPKDTPRKTSALKGLTNKVTSIADKRAELAATTEAVSAPAVEPPPQKQVPAPVVPQPAPTPTVAKPVSNPIVAGPAPKNAQSELIDPNEGANRNGDPEIWAFVDGLKIQGIRAAGRNSRLLMNGRVYKIGYTIDRKYGLKFKSANDHAVFFEDQQGRIYEKML